MTVHRSARTHGPFWAISSPTTRQISPYEKMRGEVVFREHENIAHEPHQLRPRLDHQLGALGETGCERILGSTKIRGVKRRDRPSSERRIGRSRSTFGRSTVGVGYFDPNRGRDAGYPAPPAQIRAGALTHTAPASGQTSAALSATCRLARLRGPQAACVTRTRHSVRYVLWPVDLPLAPVLRSIDSAGTLIPLFADFTATMTESDSSSPFVSGYDSSVFPSRPRH